MSAVDTSNDRAVTLDKVGQASRPPAEAHLDIQHAQDVPTVVHVLLQVFVLDERQRGGRRVRGERERERGEDKFTNCSR